MPQRAPLPSEINRRGFASKELDTFGLHRGRIAALDIKKSPVNLIYLSTDEENSEIDVARALMKSFPDMWLSHTTAARLQGLFIPERLRKDHRLHVTVPFGASPVRRRGVAGYRSRNQDRLTFVDGVRISSHVRSVLEISSLLTVQELVILGDQLVRIPRPGFENRTGAHISLDDWGALTMSAKLPKKENLLRSLAHVRVGADSPPETLLRLRLVESGYPEPELQIPAIPENKYSPTADMGYQKFRIALHYDGAVHYSASSFAKDQNRDHAFDSRGWKNIRCSAADAKAGFLPVLPRLFDAFMSQAQRLDMPLPPQIQAMCA